MMTKHPARCGSVALLMLLAACSNAPGGPDASHADPEVTKAAPSRSAAAAPATEARAATQQQTIDTKAPAITHDSISAELLATLLVGNTNRAGGLIIEPFTGPFPNGRLHPAPRVPPLRMSQQARRDVRAAGTLHIGASIAFTSNQTEYTFLDGELSSAGLSLSIAVFEEGDRFGRQPFDFEGMEKKPAGTELLHLFPEIGKMKNPEGKRYILRLGDRVPLNTVLYRWVGDDGDSIELMALRGAQAGEIRTCFNMKLPDIHRLVCSVWQLPADWRFPTPVGNYGSDRVPYGGYVVDSYPKAQGAQKRPLHWQSRFLARHEQRVPTSRPTAPTSTPISRQGVSGDVLATMVADSEALIGAEAVPANGPVPYGKLITRPDRPNLNAAPAGPGWGLAGVNRLSFLNTRIGGDGGSFRYTPLDVYMGATLRHRTSSAEGKESFDTSKPIAGGSELLNLSHNMQLSWRPADGGEESSIVLHPTRAFSARKDRIVRFDTRLHRWRSRDGQYAELLLLRGVNPDQARLCTRVQLKAVRRLQCTDWQVPAGWTLGQPLKPLGISVVDDRWLYAGEAGYHFWMGPALSR